MKRYKLTSGRYVDRFSRKVYDKGDILRIDDIKMLPEMFRNRWEEIPTRETVSKEPEGKLVTTRPKVKSTTTKTKRTTTKSKRTTTSKRKASTPVIKEEATENTVDEKESDGQENASE